MFGTRCHRIGLFVAVLLLAAGCTNGSGADQKRADQAEAQVAALQTDLADAQSQAATTASTIADLESNLAAAQADLRDTQTMLASTERTLERLRTDSQATLNEHYELAQATLYLLVEAVCQGIDTEPPSALPDSLRQWLKQTESPAGDVPDDLGVIITSAAGRDGWWVFAAEFNTRFQPGVFLQDADGGFRPLWGGFAPTEVEIRAYLFQENPDLPAELAVCVDLSPFIDGWYPPPSR
jgi:hypothetical protein